MFIHYGMSTFTGYEFGEFPADSTVYAPSGLDVDRWIRIASDAGMKYVVLTAKHCYGHCLWDSRLTDYDVATSSDKTDVIRAFVDSCRRYGVKPGFYYLLGWDKHNQKNMMPEEYETFCADQIEELLSGYGSITELWLDIPWDLGPDTDKVLARIYTKVKALQPDCLVLLNQSFVDGSTVRDMPPTYDHEEFGRPPVLLWPKDLNNGEVIPPPANGPGCDLWKDEGRPRSADGRPAVERPVRRSGTSSSLRRASPPAPPAETKGRLLGLIDSAWS
jgi:alpha-L-fucosidase